jgi:TolA-binding protein
VRGAPLLFAALCASGALAQQDLGEGADVESPFQDPAAEATIESGAEEPGELDTVSTRRRAAVEDVASLEERLYFRERPDALGAAARDYEDQQLEALLRNREELLAVRRAEAIRLLEEFLAEEPEDAAEMPDALLRLAELRWELARAEYLVAYAAWNQVPEENRSEAPPQPDYAPAIALYDRILERHRDFPRYDLVLYMKAFAVQERGMRQTALDLYTRILEEFPESDFVPDAHMAHAENHFGSQGWADALGEYEEVLRYRDSELFGLALFKSAWCLWRLDRTQEAALRFRRVLDLGRGRQRGVSSEQRARLRELQSEALEYLIQVFTEDESNTARDLFAFLEEIGGEPYADRVLVRLADRFYDQDRWVNGIEAYELLLQRLPSDERAPRWQLAVARGQLALGENEATIDALEVLAMQYGPDGSWASQQADPVVVAEANDLIERAVRRRAMRWHELAQRQEQRALFERAERLYGIYLAAYPDSDASYDIRFFRGEILFHRLARYEEAGRMYLSAAQANTTGQYTRDALYNAIGSFERVREAQLERCQAQRATGGAPPATENDGGAADGDAEATDPAAAEEAGAAPIPEDPCGETENDLRFGEAIELYVELYPNDEDLPEILFRQGRLYYDREIYDPAIRLFGQLLERFPQSPYAVTAGELILESFNRARDYQNIETWARRLKQSPAFANAESQRRLDTLILQAVFAIGEQLAGEGQHAESAQAYLRAAAEFPADERAPTALMNAGLEYQRAGDLDGAGRAYDQLIQAHPGTETGARGAWAGAEMYASIAQFADAARFYEAYGERFPEGERASDALYNAVLLRLTTGENGAAVAAAERYLERFGSAEEATEVTFLLARAHAAAEQWEQAADVYRRFVRRSRDLDRRIEAQARLAEVLARGGDDEAAAQVLRRIRRQARRQRRGLGDQGLYYAAEARFREAEAIVARYEAVSIAGTVEGLRDRLEEKAGLLNEAATAFGDVVDFQVAEWGTAALYQVGRTYELFAEALRDAPIPEGLSEDDEMAYMDELSSFIIPIEEQALTAYEGGYERAVEMQVYNRWTALLREGLVRLNDVQYPPLREMGGELSERASIPRPGAFDGLRRGLPPSTDDEADGSGSGPAASAGDGGDAPPPRRRRRRRR